jgi:hypothetical protein
VAHAPLHTEGIDATRIEEVRIVLIGRPAGADPAATQRLARREGAVLVTSDPEHLARRWPSRYPSLVLVAADPAVAAPRIQAHAHDLRRGALLLGEDLIGLQGVHTSGEIEVDGVVFSWTGELCVRERPRVVVRVDNVAAPDGGTTLMIGADSLFTTGRNGRPEIDRPALRRAIHAGLDADWRHDQPGEDTGHLPPCAEGSLGRSPPCDAG